MCPTPVYRSEVNNINKQTSKQTSLSTACSSHPSARLLSSFIPSLSHCREFCEWMSATVACLCEAYRPRVVAGRAHPSSHLPSTQTSSSTQQQSLSGHGLDKPLHQPTGLMSRGLLTAQRRYETEIRDRDTMGRDLRLSRFAKCSTLQRPQFLWLYTCKPLSSEFIDDLINTERSARTPSEYT